MDGKVLQSKSERLRAEGKAESEARMVKLVSLLLNISGTPSGFEAPDEVPDNK